LEYQLKKFIFVTSKGTKKQLSIMEILLKKDKPIFTSGIPYDEHLVKVAEIYEAVVKPQNETRKKTHKSAVLTKIQKAHLSCNSPI